MNRLGRPAELNGLAVFLAPDASGFVTGSNVLCDVSLPPPQKNVDFCSSDFSKRDLFFSAAKKGGYACY